MIGLLSSILWQATGSLLLSLSLPAMVCRHLPLMTCPFQKLMFTIECQKPLLGLQ